MSIVFFIYLFVTIVVIWAMEAININGIFKKRRVVQARVFYFLLAIAIIHLVASFIIDVFFLQDFYGALI